MLGNNTSTKTCTYHQGVNAVSYCTVCRSFLCQACDTAHNRYFRNAHKTTSANVQGPFDSRQTEHAIPLKEPKDSLREKLSDSLRTIESEYGFVRDIPQKADEKIKNAEKEREKARTTVKQCLGSIRKALELKEAEVLKAIEDNTANDSKICGLISEAQDLLKSLSEALTIGRTLLSGWDDTSTTPDFVSKMTTVTNKAKEVIHIKRAFKETCGFETFVDTSELEKVANEITYSLSGTAGVTINRKPHRPKDLALKCVGPSFALVEWKENDLDSFTVAIRKDNEEWDPKKTAATEESKYAATCLEPDTTYKFCVQSKRGRIASEWSKVIELKTAKLTPEAIIIALTEMSNNEAICLETLALLRNYVKKGKLNEKNR